MKDQWKKIAGKIDAMSLRERGMIFAAAAIVLVVLVNTFMLDPLFAKQKVLSREVAQGQNQIAGLESEIAKLMELASVDPDTVSRNRKRELQQQADNARAALRNMQKSLVSPDKIASLLENLLQRNGKLRLISLKTLVPGSVSDVVDSGSKGSADGKGLKELSDLKNAKELSGIINQKEQKDGSQPPPPPPVDKGQFVPNVGLIYRHGVEIVMSGSYLDMLEYMVALESLPWQLYWGSATLNSEDFLHARLTMTVYTLSLDQKWMNL